MLAEALGLALGLAVAVADFFGAILGVTCLTLSFLLAELPPEPEAFLFPFFVCISDSEAEEAELRVVLGKALVLGLRDGTFFAFFFDALASELLDAEEAELLELFLDLDEF